MPLASLGRRAGMAILSGWLLRPASPDFSVHTSAPRSSITMRTVRYLVVALLFVAAIALGAGILWDAES
jgi:hypothetical protein